VEADRKLARKNMFLGLVLFVIAALLVVATVVTAYVYNSVN
jgi:hypothetical protein